jgi:hypothetical protein
MSDRRHCALLSPGCPVFGDSIQFYVIDQLIGSLLDDSFSGGTTAMILIEKDRAVFDDLVVERIR